MFDVQQTIKDLSDAIEHLRESEWLQGRNFNRRGGCDAWGSIMWACSQDTAVAQQSLDRAANVGRAFYRFIGTDISVYNDTDGRTKHEVVRTLETLLAALKADPSILTAKKEKAGA